MYALLNNYYNIIIMFTVSNVPFTKVLLSFYFLYPEEGCIINFDLNTVVGSVCVCVSVCYSTSHFSNVCSSHKRYDLLNGQ